MQNNIQKIRKERGLTMKELADLAGTSQQQIDRLEKGKRKITAEWMAKLSKALECKPFELVEFATETRKNRKAETSTARVLGAIETRYSNMVREFDRDEQYEISFKPAKKDLGKNFFALVVEGGSYGAYPDNAELIFAESGKASLTSMLAEKARSFTGQKVSKLHQFEIGKNTVSGHIVKSIRNE